MQADHVEFGTVPPGWSPESWCRILRRSVQSELCTPHLARWYREWAEAIENGDASCPLSRSGQGGVIPRG